MSQRIKVLIVEDQKLMRDGYISIFKERKDFWIVGEVNNGKEAIELLDEKSADILILDIEMPVMDAFQAIPIIKKCFPEVKILIVSMHEEEALTRELISMGANGYLSKNSSDSELCVALHAIIKDGFYFNKNIAKSLLFDNKKDLPVTLKSVELTETEEKVLRFICEGKTSKEIGKELNISENTIEFHRKNIFKKSNSKSLAGLIKYAIRKGLTGLNSQ